MYSKLAPVFGSLAIASLVSAVPVEKRDIYFGSRGGHANGWGDSGSYSASAAAPSYSAPASNGYYQPSATTNYGGAPPSQTYGSSPPYGSSGSGSNSGGSSDGSTSIFKFPTSDGFPNIQNPSDALNAIQQAAHGILPNGPPPPTPPAADDLTSLRFIAFNELFEVAFFTELLFNITHSVPGYEYQDQGEQQNIIDAITAVVAQEKEHLLNINGALAHFNAGPIQPCVYQSPVSDLKTAISVARTFTDVVLGTLPDVQVHLGQNGDIGLIRAIGSVIGQEGEQNGFYRSLSGLIPSSSAFLTASARELAFSALNQAFVVPGSCPNANTIDLPIFGALSPSPQFLDAKDQDITFSFSATGQYSQYANNYQSLSLVFINQQNVPVVATINGATVDHAGNVNFSAKFPFSQFLMNGLTIAVVVEGQGPFASITDVVAAAKFGPSLIEVN
jgi:hypothetical protein